MSSYPLNPFPISAIGMASIPVFLWGISALIIWISFRARKLEPPKLRFVAAIAFLQILLGVLSMYLVEKIKYDPFMIIGGGLGIILLSGLLFLRMFLKNDWKKIIGVWAISSILQLVILPACSAVMLLAWFVFYFMNHPPQP